MPTIWCELPSRKKFELATSGNIAWFSCFVKAQKFIPFLVVAAGLLAYNHRFMASYPNDVVTSRGDHHDLTPQSVTRFP